MHILVYKCKSFHNGATVVTVGPESGPQIVPDWVRETNTFKLSVQDGSVQEIQVLTPAVPAAVPAPAPDVSLEPTAKKRR